MARTTVTTTLRTVTRQHAAHSHTSPRCAQSHVSRLRAELAAPYRALQECARTVATVARECRLEIDVEECVVFAQRGGFHPRAPFSPPAPHFQPAF